VWSRPEFLAHLLWHRSADGEQHAHSGEYASRLFVRSSTEPFDSANLCKSRQRACAADGLGTLADVEGSYDKRYTELLLTTCAAQPSSISIQADVSEKAAMGISGHKTRAAFDRYRVIDAEDAVNAVHQVPGLPLATSIAQPPVAISSKG
jgi:hypothetical protein